MGPNMGNPDQMGPNLGNQGPMGVKWGQTGPNGVAILVLVGILGLGGDPLRDGS